MIIKNIKHSQSLKSQQHFFLGFWIGFIKIKLFYLSFCHLTSAFPIFCNNISGSPNALTSTYSAPHYLARDSASYLDTYLVSSKSCLLPKNSTSDFRQYLHQLLCYCWAVVRISMSAFRLCLLLMSNTAISRAAFLIMFLYMDSMAVMSPGKSHWILE